MPPATACWRLAACDEQAAASPPKPAVGVHPAAMKGVSESFEFVGHIQAIYKVDLRALPIADIWRASLTTAVQLSQSLSLGDGSCPVVDLLG